MATTETTVRVVARDVHTDDTRRWDGVTGSEPEYGTVQVVRITTTQRYSAESTGRRSGRARLGEPERTEEVLCTLDVEAAQTLIASLTGALVSSLRVTPSYRAQVIGKRAILGSPGDTRNLNRGGL